MSSKLKKTTKVEKNINNDLSNSTYKLSASNSIIKPFNKELV